MRASQGKIMKAADVMTRKVVAVSPETPTRDIALVLFKNAISAVPVVDERGAPIGMVSEGDLMPRDESEREARRDWWLKLMAEGEDLSTEFLQQIAPRDRLAREVMHAPVETVDEAADLVDVAELLTAKRIKRAPVLRDGRMVGIVSRADLVRTVARVAPEPEPSLADDSELPVASERLAALGRDKPKAQPAPAPAGDGGISADAFRGLVHHHEDEESTRREEANRELTERHHQEAAHLLHTPLTEEAWQRMLGEARAAARRGEEEHLLLRFPCELCTDHGRAINAPDAGWPATLRGLAAHVFMRWKSELRPHGFALHARVLEFPGGLPGDIGLFLAWGK
jgi:CBS domain-containing protein